MKIAERLKCFLRGMASINIFPRIEERPKIEMPTSAEDAFKKDAEALAGDWRTVGSDMKSALRKLEKNRQEAQESIRIRDEELLRVKTTAHGAAHALDNLCIEFGFGPNVPPAEAADKIRSMVKLLRERSHD